ncbi:recombination protein O N-terminal domain-containing protein [Altererythrobacter arenosus]|uniref:Recombination protein O N-terminal domain-containing protein n=1 Tax=Altererythrobacter arenosus TaxID=3032592 RepID=A0ABY8FQS8_9SPHN|nr:recombination protein O N-terminal domain-containing protein [Altererythrobacter sp. CAU 1644]WFL76600.1 recombination protein O N-terminal domain-containing protein [Altererythrobacter sp. CAU 1644]
MNLRAPAILIASRQHGETASIARLLTGDHGVVACYVAGGRGRQLRPVMIPGNLVEVDLRAKSDSQMPFARLELIESRGPWLTEPLPAAAITWACALTASALPERNPYPALYLALEALLGAVCQAPSARGWFPAMNSYEALLLRELGYGGERPEIAQELTGMLANFDALEGPLARYLLADKRGDVMAARHLLRERLARMLA